MFSFFYQLSKLYKNYEHILFAFPFLYVKTHTRKHYLLHLVIRQKKFGSLWTITEQIAASMRDSEIIKRTEGIWKYLSSPSHIFLQSLVSQDRLRYYIFKSSGDSVKISTFPVINIEQPNKQHRPYSTL